jgi:hypothetical protein
MGIIWPLRKGKTPAFAGVFLWWEKAEGLKGQVIAYLQDVAAEKGR